MNLRGWRVFGVVAGILISGGTAWAAGEALLIGKGRLAVGVESELGSRDVKVSGGTDRLQVTQQSLQLRYGVLKNLDLFMKAGLGKVAFEKEDSTSQTHGLWGVGFQGTMPLEADPSYTQFVGGYFIGASAQYLSGKASKFKEQDEIVPTEDQWAELSASLFVGSRDLLKDPEPALRLYTGVRFSSRSDKRRPKDGPSSTARQDSSIGGMIGADYTDRNIFRFNTELGTGDRKSLLIRFGLGF